MSLRKESRLKKIFRIKLKDEADTYPAVVTSISKTGLSVTTPHVFPTYKVIDVLVKIGEKVIPIKGSIRWVQEAPPGSEKREDGTTIGISLQNPPEEYLCHFDED